MLEPWETVLTLSTTIPLVPPASSTGLTRTPIGNAFVMSKDLMQPLLSEAVQPPCTDTKRKSVPVGWRTSVTLGLKNAVSGEQPFPPVNPICVGPPDGTGFMVVSMLKLSWYKAGLDPAAVVPHAYRCPEPGPPVR